MPPGGTVIIEGSETDPWLSYLTLGVAALSVAGTIWVAYRQHKQAAELWRRSESRKSYAGYLQHLTSAIMHLQRTQQAKGAKREEKIAEREKQHAEYDKALIAMNLSMNEIQILGSQRVRAGLFSISRRLNNAHESLHSDRFDEEIRSCIKTQTTLTREMAKDLGIKVPTRTKIEHLARMKYHDWHYKRY